MLGRLTVVFMFLWCRLASYSIVSASTSAHLTPRHWSKLPNTSLASRPAGVAQPSESPDMPMSEILELGLHTCNADVEAITDQALKEEQPEAALVKLEEVWIAIEFYMRPLQ